MEIPFGLAWLDSISAWVLWDGSSEEPLVSPSWIGGEEVAGVDDSDKELWLLQDNSRCSSVCAEENVSISWLCTTEPPESLEGDSTANFLKNNNNNSLTTISIWPWGQE